MPPRFENLQPQSRDCEDGLTAKTILFEPLDQSVFLQTSHSPMDDSTNRLHFFQRQELAYLLKRDGSRIPDMQENRDIAFVGD